MMIDRSSIGYSNIRPLGATMNSILAVTCDSTSQSWICESSNGTTSNDNYDFFSCCARELKWSVCAGCRRLERQRSIKSILTGWKYQGNFLADYKFYSREYVGASSIWLPPLELILDRLSTQMRIWFIELPLRATSREWEIESCEYLPDPYDR